ncbi:unnamed protein product [Nippostrongylus brasiliensis]|uniref:Deltameth_res domain-containing protein n=1 Tax=Nippostrongylus brasiliensis TaxID=27835 RepID=A0A0N4YLS8_NIPBR|nr:unnamed protein product [Nippostrongylus brasiliensis]
MNRAILSRFAALRRVMQQPKRSGSGGHHDVVNPGPPVTLDYMAVPFQPYAKVHAELQSKFNTYLAISASLFAVSLGLVSPNPTDIARGVRIFRFRLPNSGFRPFLAVPFRFCVPLV